MSEQDFSLIVCGGCNAKIGPGELGHLLKDLPYVQDPRLLVGFDVSDDAAVMKLTDDLAIISTLDFFPTMVTDPYLFGAIAATNALSDIYAMGGTPICALNIVAFPEEADLSILKKILQGGAEKIKEANAVLAGGHSIHDDRPKYGLSVTGTVHPDKIWRNIGAKEGDYLYLTKPLGVGIVTTAYSVEEVSEEAFKEATSWMTTLNKYAAELLHGQPVHSCTDVTGFGLLGHLSEMLTPSISAVLKSEDIPYLPEAYQAAEEFLVTAGGQRNRNHMAKDVEFKIKDAPLEEILFDPQTSGGLLFTIAPQDSDRIEQLFAKAKISLWRIGRMTSSLDKKIVVE